MRKLRLTGLLLLSTAILFSLNNCGGGGSSAGSGSSAPIPSTAPATVGVVITDKPVAGFDQALATIDSVELIGDDGKVMLYDGPPVTVDLLALRDYQELFTVADDVPPGEYEKIRLRLESLELVKLDDMGAVKESVDVRLVANGKVDLNPRDGFIVQPGSTLFITLDFDMAKALKLTLSGKDKQPKLRPVIFVKISDQEPMGRLARVRGEVDQIDAATGRLRICSVQRVSQMTSWWDDRNLDICVLVTTGDSTVVFGPDGLPAGFGDLAIGDPVTIVGRLVMVDPMDDLLAQPVAAAIGMDDDGWKGEWDRDHDWDRDWGDLADVQSSSKKKKDDKKKGKDKDDDKDDDVCQNSVNLLGGNDDCDDDDDDRDDDKDDDKYADRDDDKDDDDKDDDKDDRYDGPRFGIAALLIEEGVPGTFRIWKGVADSAIDSVSDTFGLALDAGQGFTEGSVIQTQLYPETWLVSLQGELLERDELNPTERAAVDGVININGSTELRAALVVVDNTIEGPPPGPGPGPGPGPDPVPVEFSGEIIGIDTAGQTITVMTATEQQCVNLSLADIVLISDPTGGPVTEMPYTNFDIFGPGGTAKHFEARHGDGVIGGAFEIAQKDGEIVVTSDQAVWTNGVPQSFTLTHSSTTGDLLFTLGGRTLVWDLEPAVVYQKISILAKAEATAGWQTTISNLQLDGAPLTNDTVQADAGLKSGVALNSSGFSDFTVTGDLTLSWTTTPPSRAAMQAFIGVDQVGDGIQTSPGTIADLQVGQQIDVFGLDDGGCIEAETVIVTVE